MTWDKSSIEPLIRALYYFFRLRQVSSSYHVSSPLLNWMFFENSFHFSELLFPYQWNRDNLPRPPPHYFPMMLGWQNEFMNAKEFFKPWRATHMQTNIALEAGQMCVRQEHKRPPSELCLPVTMSLFVIWLCLQRVESIYPVLDSGLTM